MRSEKEELAILEKEVRTGKVTPHLFRAKRSVSFRARKGGYYIGGG